MKDTAGGGDAIFRPNALRSLRVIVDSTTVQSVERIYKTAIVDKSSSVSSAAIVSSYHLLPIAQDIVRKWSSEIAEAASNTKSSGGFSLGFSSSNSVPTNSSTFPQYHALSLLARIRANDRMQIVKMVQQFSVQGVVKNQMALVMLVRQAAALAETDPSLRAPMFTLLKSWLRHKAEMVNFEAAKMIAELEPSDEDAMEAIHVLQLFLSSPRAVTKLAAIRILHLLSSVKPNLVASCNSDIETLIVNQNRSVSTFAITTLLHTCTESSVERLMKQISGFMTEITDEFKITIVQAVRSLCLKFPSKQILMLGFLSGILRDEGGYDFKLAVVESMFDLIKFVPEAKEDALAHLCEFIEDCEFTKLAVRILHLLGQEGPTTSMPTKYIRYIYNRVVLENAVVRASAVSALAKFGVGQSDAEVKRSVSVLLTRCLDDVDDEVRDRAALALRLMEEDDAMAKRFITNDNTYTLAHFESQLISYVTADDKSIFDTAFDMESVPTISKEQAYAEDRTKKLTAITPTVKAPKVTKAAPSSGEAAATATAVAQKYIQQLQAIPEINPYGAPLKSSSIVELTESETEYVVSVIKHIFNEHVVLQYDIKNTLEDTVLEGVSVVATPSDEEELEEDFIIPAPALKTNEPGTVYVSFRRVNGAGSIAVSTFTNVLKFTTKEIDPTTGEPEEIGYDDEYQVEDVDLSGADYVVPAFAGNFSHVWEQVGAAGEEAEATLALENVKTIVGASRLLIIRALQNIVNHGVLTCRTDATEQLAKALSLQPLEGTDMPVNNTTHTLKLYGKTVTGGRTAANVRMAASKSGVTCKVTIRAEEEGFASIILSAIA